MVLGNMLFFQQNQAIATWKLSSNQGHDDRLGFWGRTRMPGGTHRHFFGITIPLVVQPIKWLLNPWVTHQLNPVGFP